MDIYNAPWLDYYNHPTTNPILRTLSTGILLDEPNDKLTVRIYVQAGTQALAKPTQVPTPGNIMKSGNTPNPGASPTGQRLPIPGTNGYIPTLFTYDDIVWQQINVDQVFDLAVLRNKRGWSDYQMWAIANSPNGLVTQINEPLPLFTQTAATHFTADTALRALQFVMPFCLNVPFASSKLANCFLWARTGPEGKLMLLSPETANSLNVITPSAPGGVPTLENLQKQRFFGLKLTLNPPVSTIVPNNGSAVTVDVQVVDGKGLPITTDLDVYFDNVNGSISHNRRRTKGGKTSVNVMAVHMDAGDIITLKAGTKYFRALSQIDLTVY
jgi:hypothetical protein